MLDLTNRYYYDTVDSTNDRAKELAREHCPEGTIVSAGNQSSGKGRRGRRWESQPDIAIATSMVLYPTVPMEHISSLTLVAAVAVTRAIYKIQKPMENIQGLSREKRTILQPQIKWPNDILLKKRKICGILTEMSVQNQKTEYVVVGIGVNVHNRHFPEEIRDKATSLDLAMAQGGISDGQVHISRRVLTDEIWGQFALLYETFQQTEDLTFLQEEYQQSLINCNQQVRVLDPMGVYEGVALGINPRGELLVKTDGVTRAVSSGEVSVRGMDGYV